MSTTRLGTSVGGYRLESLLGRGGMSVVYLAEHAHLGRKVALKLLTASLSGDESFRERFERESQRAAALEHPNVIPIYDAGEINGELYIAMKYVRGSDLKALIAADAPMNVGRVLFLLEQAAAALDAAHEQELVHRDVKPANLLVEEAAERVYVSDFGVVKHASSPGVTKTGLFIGTADYAAPEQIEGLQVDARTDVYGLTCVLYECLTGRQPFDREAEVAVMHAHLTEPPPAVTAVRGELPVAIDSVVARGMAKSKEERYPSCQQMVSAARAGLLQQPVADPAPVAPAAVTAAVAQDVEGTDPLAPQTPVVGLQDEAAPRPGRARLWAIVGASSALAAAVAAVAVFLVTRSDDAPTGASPAPAAAAAPAPPEADTQSPLTASPAEDDRSGAGTGAGDGSGGGDGSGSGAGDGSGQGAGDEPSADATSQGNGAEAEESAAGEPAAAADGPGQGSGAPADVGDPEALLSQIIPPQIFATCTVAEEPSAGAVATARCVEQEQNDLRFSPDTLEISAFATGRALDAAYQAMLADLPSSEAPGPGSGRCNGTRWFGEGDWEHGPGRPGGARFCAFSGDDALIVWTHRKFGQEDHVNMLGVAREGGINHPGLFDWWRFWVHRIGLS